MAPQSRADAPLAEYWIGSHPTGPAQIELEDGRLLPLDVALRQYSHALLGERCAERFQNQLPFMVKVLSVNKEHGLSIQLHPTKEQAGRLRAQAPEHYPDGNHKPEVGVALTEVSLVLGCKSLAQLLGVLRDLPGLRNFLDTDLLARLNVAPNSSGEEAALVKEVFSALISLQERQARECLGYVHAALPGVASLRREAEVFSRLMPRYGMGDVGLLALVLMNHVNLRPGEAVFIAPNVPHAYLDGDLFECMACSDNVVRAGLTPKFKDIPALVELLDCSAVPGAGGVSVARVGSFSVVETPTEEFCVRMLSHGEHRATIRSEEGPGILLCVGKSLSVRGVSTGKVLEVSDGGGVFIPANSGEYELVTSNSSVFYVTPFLT
jgi:mannose-6-phosphate isomerase